MGYEIHVCMCVCIPRLSRRVEAGCGCGISRARARRPPAALLPAPSPDTCELWLRWYFQYNKIHKNKQNANYVVPVVQTTSENRINLNDIKKKVIIICVNDHCVKPVIKQINF